MAPAMKLSPSGRQIAFIEGIPADIFRYDLDRRVKTRLTTNPAVDHSAVWSPDGSRVVFDSHRPDPGGRGEGAGLYEKPSNGATAEQPILDRENGVQHSPRDWSSDGSVLIFARQGQNGRWNLRRFPLTGDRNRFVSQWRLQRKRSIVVARRPVPRIHVERVGQERGHCAAVSGSQWRSLADFH